MAFHRDVTQRGRVRQADQGLILSDVQRVLIVANQVRDRVGRRLGDGRVERHRVSFHQLFGASCASRIANKHAAWPPTTSLNTPRKSGWLSHGNLLAVVTMAPTRHSLTEPQPGK